MTAEQIERRHRRHRSIHPIPMCWQCQREMAVCRSKQQYDTWYEAFEAGEYINQRLGYSMYEYRCPYCDRWHLATATTREKYRKVERRRRQWLRDQREGNDEVWTSI